MVRNIAANGDPDEAFAAFPAPFRTDPHNARLEKIREWNRFAESDSINQRNSMEMLIARRSGADIRTLDEFETIHAQLSAAVPGAELGTFIFIDRLRNMELGAVPSDFRANNFLAVPEVSRNVDATMGFLNWIFTNSDNHALFELGIEGTHWVDINERTFALPEGVDPLLNYTFPGFVMTWNPNFVRFADTMPAHIRAYREFELNRDMFRQSALMGFQFDPEPVRTEMARLAPIVDEVRVPLAHGILENPVQVQRDNTARMRQNGLDIVEAEFVRQLNEFLASR